MSTTSLRHNGFFQIESLPWDATSLFLVGGRTICVGVVDITPALAEELLKLNQHNRNLTPTKVDQIASDISAGQFKFNALPIIIDERPEIVDGQHRLHGIVKAGITVPMLVVSGVATDVTDTIDTLTKPRSVSDILKMTYQHESLKNRSYVDGIATILLIGLTSRSSHSKREIAKYADTIIEDISEWASFGKSVQAASQKIVVQRGVVRSSMSASSVGALCYHMISSGASNNLVRDFFKRIAEGKIADSDCTNIIPLLRRRQSSGILLSPVGGRSQISGVFTEFATYITAYNRWVAGESQQRIQGNSSLIRGLSALPAVSRIGSVTT